MVIIRLKEKNDLVLYQRQRGKETNIPLYVIMRNGIMVEEYRTLKQAEKMFIQYAN